MLPSIEKLMSCDVYRDGGSLSISFESSGGTEYTLFFGIKHDITPEKKILPVGYKPPVLQKYVKSEYVSKITGISHPEIGKADAEISWKEATFILDECGGFISSFEAEYSWVYPRMVEIAESEGAYHENS